MDVSNPSQDLVLIPAVGGPDHLNEKEHYLSTPMRITNDSGSFDILPTEWDPETTTIDHIQVCAVGGKANIFGLTRGGQIFRLTDRALNRLEWNFFDTAGKRFIDICCVKTTLFAIGTDRLLYRWNNMTKPQKLFIEGDTQRLRQVTAMNKRTVYGLAEDGTVLFAKRGLASTKPKSLWTPVGNQKMKKISTGSKHLFRKVELWAVGLDDRAHRYDHFNDIWVMYDIIVNDLSVTRDNAVYAVRKKDGRLMKWNGGDKFVLQDLGSKPTEEHRLLNVSAYKERKEVYSVDENGNLLKMSYDH